MNSEVEKKLKLINAQVVLWMLLFSVAIYRFEETIGFGLAISNIGKGILFIALIVILLFVRKSMINNYLKDDSSHSKKRQIKKFSILTVILLSAVITFFAIKMYVQG